MPLDSSIIMGVRPPDIQNPLDSYTKALTIKSLINKSQIEGNQAQQSQQDFSDSQAMRSAMSNNTTIDANGTPSFNKAGVLSDLAKSSPSLVPKAAQSFASMDYEMQQQKLKSIRDQIDTGGQILNGAKDQKSYTDALNQMKAIGLPTDNLPAQYDPNIVNAAQAKAMNVKDHIDTQLKGQEVQNKAQELAIERRKLFGDMGSGAPGSGIQTNRAGSKQAGQPGQTGQSTNLSPVDPAIYLKHMPQADQEAMAKEIAHNQNISEVAPDLVDTQNQIIQALKDHDFRKVKALQNTYNSQMGTAFKDVEGSARQAAVEHQIEATMPGLQDIVTGGAPQRQQALKTFLTSGQASPRSTANGLDLAKFEKTTVNPEIFTKMIKTDSAPAQTIGSGKGNKYLPTQAEAAAELARRQSLKQSQASK